jgi:hypothetical protein
MNHIFKYLAALIFLIASTPDNLSAKKTEIKLHLKKGQQFEYVVTETLSTEQRFGGNPVEIEQIIKLTINQVVLDKLRNGNYLIQADYKRFTFEKDSPEGNQGYDSNAANNIKSLDDVLSRMTMLHLKYEISPVGVVSNLTGFEDLIKDVAIYTKLIRLINDFGTDKIIFRLFDYFPKTNVEAGDKWVNIDSLSHLNNFIYDINYTLAEASPENIKLERLAKIKYISEKPVLQYNKEVSIDETGTQKGDVFLDPKNNMPLSSLVTQNTNILITSVDTTLRTKERAQLKISSKTTVKLVK